MNTDGPAPDPVDEYVTRVVDAMPPLTADAKAQFAAILKPAAEGAA